MKTYRIVGYFDTDENITDVISEIQSLLENSNISLCITDYDDISEDDEE